MGNCLILQEKVVRVMKPDGKILDYKALTEVRQVLSDFSDHAVSDALQASRSLLPDTKLLAGRLYYLVPVPLPQPEVKNKVRFSIPEEEKDGQGNAVIRIKLVISKQELQEMLKKGGVSVDDMVSQLQAQQRVHKVDMCKNEDNHKGWKPALESIPEIR